MGFFMCSEIKNGREILLFPVKMAFFFIPIYWLNKQMWPQRKLFVAMPLQKYIILLIKVKKKNVE